MLECVPFKSNNGIKSDVESMDERLRGMQMIHNLVPYLDEIL